MSFLSILKGLVDSTNKSVACALMGVDGLPIEKYVNPEASCDVETLAVEYCKVLDEVKNAAAILSLGSVEEVVINTLGMDIVMRIVSPEYFFAFVVSPGANVGKARFMLRRAVAQARKELIA